MKEEKQNLSERLIPDNQSSHSKKSHRSGSSSTSVGTASSLGFFEQSRLLIYKNVILTFKNPKNLIFLIITPFLLSYFLFVFQGLARDNGKRTREFPTTHPLPAFPHCYGKNCYSLQYRVISQNRGPAPDWVNYTIDYIKLQSGLEDKDIKTNDSITNITDLTNFHQTYYNYPNTTQIALLFCDGNNNDFVLNKLYCNGTGDFVYYMMLNKTDSLSVIFHDFLEPLPIDSVSASLKVLVDNALLSYIQNPDIKARVKKISYDYTQFPIGENHYIDNYDIVSNIGAFYYLITPLFAFMFIQNQIVREKQYKLRQGLNIFGASHSAYWVSWFIVSNIYALVASVSTYFAGYSFGFGFFTETPFYFIIFFMMYPFTLAMQMLSYFISTLAPTLKVSNTVSYGIMLFAIVVQSFVSDNMLLTFLFSEDITNLVRFIKYFLCFYPPFSYTKIFTNITQYSGYQFSFRERRWIPSLIPYDFSIFMKDVRSVLPFGGGYYYRYSDFYSMLVLYMDVAFFILLTWYFDQIISSNRGRGEPFYFPLKRIYNLFKKKEKKRYSNANLASSHGFTLNDEQLSAIKQRNKVYHNSANNVPAYGLRIKNLSKTFGNMCSSNKVEALKNFNLQIEGNELMGILGHNGAGKTTLINILTGVINPDETEGLEITIDNHPIEEINEIRKHIGVCSQFDILWNELTAGDHLYMFARLKNIPVEQVNSRIDQILEFVSLSSERNNKVGSFSGGMKRRLSLAISAIGNPKIILLDEPTTGLDPKVRQQVWHLIEKLKQGKSIILTTHSMEEADILADRISVVAKGKLKCVGTSFYLKKTYGQGHRITINLKDSSEEKQVVDRIQKFFPNVREVDCRGGNLIMGITDYQDLLQLVKKLESKQSLGLDEYQLKKAIKAWAVSHSTLEEVFMKVSKEKQQ